MRNIDTFFKDMIIMGWYNSHVRAADQSQFLDGDPYIQDIAVKSLFPVERCCDGNCKQHLVAPAQLAQRFTEYVIEAIKAYGRAGDIIAAIGCIRGVQQIIQYNIFHQYRIKIGDHDPDHIHLVNGDIHLV